MKIPLIIKVASNRTYPFKSIRELQNKLGGERECSFYFHSCIKNRKKILVAVDNSGFNICLTIKDGDNMALYYPEFLGNEKVTPFKILEPAKKAICEIIFENEHQNTQTILAKSDHLNQFKDIYDFIEGLSKITKPVTPYDAKADREIWAAYCDGLDALMQRRMSFIEIISTGKPMLYNDNVQGDIYTLRLDIGVKSKEPLESKIHSLLKSRYQIELIDTSEDKSSINVILNGSEALLPEDMDSLSELLSEYGYLKKSVGVNIELNASISIEDTINTPPHIQIIRNRLDEEKIKYEIIDRYKIKLFSSSDVKTLSTIYHESVESDEEFSVSEFIKIPIVLQEGIWTILKDEIGDNETIRLYKQSLHLRAINEADFTTNRSELSKLLKKYKISLDIPDFYVEVSIKNQRKEYDWRKESFQRALEMAVNLKAKASKFEYEEEKARVMRFSFNFSSDDERIALLEELDSIMKSLGSLYKLTVKRPYGICRISFQKDNGLREKYESDILRQYKGEEIKLAKKSQLKQRELSNSVNLNNRETKEEYNKFIFECPVIGTCYSRSSDSIIVQLSDDFYNGEKFNMPIEKGDQIFFPSVGEYTDLKRQKDAMLRIDKAGTIVNGKKVQPPVNQNLIYFLFNPVYAAQIDGNIPEKMRYIKAHALQGNVLNDKQLEAVAKSMMAKDISIIQGPPGTGKTTVIAEIIWQELRQNPKSKILLTSQTNLAVDNALERLKKQKQIIRPLRIVSESKIQMDDILYNHNMLEDWVKRPDEYNKMNIINQWIDDIIEKVDMVSYPEITGVWKEFLRKKGETVRKFFYDKYRANINLIGATCSICGSQGFRSLVQSVYDTDSIEFDVVIMDEASKATPLEMAIPLVLGKRIIIIGDHKQLPPVLGDEEIGNAIRNNSMYEELQNLGENELANRIADLKESQFKKLFQGCMRDNKSLVTTLDTQYRMHKQIMNTINHFYEDELGSEGLICGIESDMDKPDYSVPGSRWHGISMEPFISEDTHAIWVNVEGKEERTKNLSYKNEKELEAIEMVVKALTQANGFREYIRAQKGVENKEIGIITFYSAQKKEIKNLELDPMYNYRIDVVDRFQGMERNIVLVSTVRSNKRNDIGFAKEIERINVAFSRARSLLIVIGNREVFRTKGNYQKSIGSMDVVDLKQIKDLLRHA